MASVAVPSPLRRGLHGAGRDAGRARTERHARPTPDTPSRAGARAGQRTRLPSPIRTVTVGSLPGDSTVTVRAATGRGLTERTCPPIDHRSGIAPNPEGGVCCVAGAKDSAQVRDSRSGRYGGHRAGAGRGPVPGVSAGPGAGQLAAMSPVGGRDPRSRGTARGRRRRARRSGDAAPRAAPGARRCGPSRASRHGASGYAPRPRAASTAAPSAAVSGTTGMATGKPGDVRLHLAPQTGRGGARRRRPSRAPRSRRRRSAPRHGAARTRRPRASPGPGGPGRVSSVSPANTPARPLVPDGRTLTGEVRQEDQAVGTGFGPGGLRQQVGRVVGVMVQQPAQPVERLAGRVHRAAVQPDAGQRGCRPVRARDLQLPGPSRPRSRRTSRRCRSPRRRRPCPRRGSSRGRRCPRR